MRNVSYKICREYQSTFYVQKAFFSENRDLYKITWKNMVEADNPYVTVQCCVERMRFGWRIT